jgi:hypothetical protein
MATKGLSERRHQTWRAKARTLRKIKLLWGKDYWRGASEKERKRVLGIQSKARKMCSCWMCQSGPWEKETKSGLRAVAAAEYREPNLPDEDYDYEESCISDDFLRSCFQLDLEEYQARVH